MKIARPAPVAAVARVVREAGARPVAEAIGAAVRATVAAKEVAIAGQAVSDAWKGRPRSISTS